MIVYVAFLSIHMRNDAVFGNLFIKIVGHPEPEKNSVGIFEYILACVLRRIGVDAKSGNAP